MIFSAAPNVAVWGFVAVWNVSEWGNAKWSGDDGMYERIAGSSIDQGAG